MLDGVSPAKGGKLISEIPNVVEAAAKWDKQYPHVLIKLSETVGKSPSEMYEVVGTVKIPETLKLDIDLMKDRSKKFKGEADLEQLITTSLEVLYPKNGPVSMRGLHATKEGFEGKNYLVLKENFDKDPIYTVLHEGISHASDKQMFRLLDETSGKSLRNLHSETAMPEDIFSDPFSLAPNYFRGDPTKPYQNAALPEEERALTRELIRKINAEISSRTGKSLEEVYNTPKLLSDYVDANLNTPEKMSKFLDAHASLYGEVYSGVLKSGKPEERVVFMKRLQNSIKYLPSLALPIIVTNEKSK